MALNNNLISVKLEGLSFNGTTVGDIIIQNLTLTGTTDNVIITGERQEIKIQNQGVEEVVFVMVDGSVKDNKLTLQIERIESTIPLRSDFIGNIIE